MKASELRIGNYTNYTVSEETFIAEVQQIDLIDVLIEFTSFVTITAKATPECNLHGIPLTEEWLIKFGFDKSVIFGTHTKESKEGHLVEIDYKYRFYYSTAEPSTRFQVKIKYVHQLQNLYFALTGEDLTIVPTEKKN